jgi:hypothetical protein
MGCASDKTLALADRSVAGSGGDPNRGSFHPAFADESIDPMCNRSSDGFKVLEYGAGGKSMAEIHTGGCHCGHLHYQFSGPLHDIAHCHCSICRRVSGGIVTTWITVPASAFEWVKGIPAQYDSSTNCVHRCDHRHPRSSRAGTRPTAYLDGQPSALAASGRTFARRSRGTVVN